MYTFKLDKIDILFLIIQALGTAFIVSAGLVWSLESKIKKQNDRAVELKCAEYVVVDNEVVFKFKTIEDINETNR